MREEGKFKVVHVDEETNQELLKFEDSNLDEPLVVVKVENSTPEPDGSRKLYFLTVPPDMKTCKQAVAWTFNKDGKDYNPEQEG
jgi:hypothetical protein